MNKLTKEEIERELDNEEDIAVYRMFSSKGVDLRMRIAEWYYNHYNVFSYIVIQIPLLIVDAIDIIMAVVEKRNRKT